MCTGNCRLECLGGDDWAIISDTCSLGCACQNITHKGMIGDIETVDCLPAPDPGPGGG